MKTKSKLPTIRSAFAPTLFTSAIDGRKWMIAIGQPWIEVPKDTTRTEVHKAWIPIVKQKVEPKLVKKVLSRGKQFTVTLADKWSCSCSTFKTKRKCLHIEQVKAEIK